MTSQAPALLMLRRDGGPRSRLMRQARLLALLSIGWMTVEAVVAIAAALFAGSVALLGFGLDSLIELTSASAIVFMPLLAKAKGRVARELSSAATAGDAAQSWLCAIGAAAVLISILANAALGWWWLDPIAGLGIAGLAVREGRQAWAGEVCGDCAPIGLESAERCRPNGCR